MLGALAGGGQALASIADNHLKKQDEIDLLAHHDAMEIAKEERIIAAHAREKELDRSYDDGIHTRDRSEAKQDAKDKFNLENSDEYINAQNKTSTAKARAAHEFEVSTYPDTNEQLRIKEGITYHHPHVNYAGEYLDNQQKAKNLNDWSEADSAQHKVLGQVIKEAYAILDKEGNSTETIKRQNDTITEATNDRDEIYNRYRLKGGTSSNLDPLGYSSKPSTGDVSKGSAYAAAGPNEYDQVIKDAANTNNVPYSRLRAVFQTESGLRQFDKNGNILKPGEDGKYHSNQGMSMVSGKWFPHLKDQLSSPEGNADAGAQVLREAYDQTDPKLSDDDRWYNAYKIYNLGATGGKVEGRTKYADLVEARANSMDKIIANSEVTKESPKVVSEANPENITKGAIDTLASREETELKPDRSTWDNKPELDNAKKVGAVLSHLVNQASYAKENLIRKPTGEIGVDSIYDNQSAPKVIMSKKATEYFKANPKKFNDFKNAKTQDEQFAILQRIG